MACRSKSNSDGSRISSASRMPSRERMYSKVPSTLSVADVNTVVCILSSRTSRTILDTSIGADRVHLVQQDLAHDPGYVYRRGAKKDPAAAKLDEIDVLRVVGPQEDPQLVAQLARPPRQSGDILPPLRFGVVVPAAGRSSSGVLLQPDSNQQRQRCFDEIERAREIRR